MIRREARAHGTSALLVGLSMICMVAALAGYQSLGLITAGTFALLALGPPLARCNLMGVTPQLPNPLVTTAGLPARWELGLDTGGRTVRDLRVSLDEGRRDVGSLAAGWSAELRGQPARVELQTRFATRGHHDSVQLELRSAWPFGWLEERRRWAIPADLWVLPRVIQLSSAALMGTDHGEEHARTRGHAGEIFALREWRAGEDTRHVAWKLSARRGRRLLTERREANLPSLRLHLLLPMGTTPPAHSYPFEAAVVLAASLLAQYARAGAQVQLVVEGQGPQTGEPLVARQVSELIPMLRRLALVKPQAGDLDNTLASIAGPGRGETVWAIASAALGVQAASGIRTTDAPEATLEALRPSRRGMHV